MMTQASLTTEAPDGKHAAYLNPSAARTMLLLRRVPR